MHGGDRVIQMEAIQKHFGPLHVLKSVDLTVKAGEKLVVIGPSGSGKSTLIRCMNLLERPSAGRVIVDGVEITAPKAPVEKVRQSMAMVSSSSTSTPTRPFSKTSPWRPF
jgi:putative glutamine transport system ATP-binding protein